MATSCRYLFYTGIYLDAWGFGQYLCLLSMKNTGSRILLAALLLVLLLIGVGGMVVWVKVSALKGQLADNLGRALGAEVEITFDQSSISGKARIAGGWESR